MTNNLAKSLFRKMNLVGLREYCELRRPRKSLRRGTKKRKGISIVENLENRRRGADRSLFASKKRSALRQLDRPAEAQKESRPPTTGGGGGGGGDRRGDSHFQPRKRRKRKLARWRKRSEKKQPDARRSHARKEHAAVGRAKTWQPNSTKMKLGLTDFQKRSRKKELIAIPAEWQNWRDK